MAEEQRMQKIISSMSNEDIAAACLMNIQSQAMNQPFPLIFRNNFSKTIVEAMMEHKDDTNPFSHLMMMLEELNDISAKIIVSLSAMGPEFLKRDMQLSEENMLLIRRNIEEMIFNAAQQSLKKAVIELHTIYTGFLSETEKREAKACGNVSKKS